MNIRRICKHPGCMRIYRYETGRHDSIRFSPDEGVAIIDSYAPGGEKHTGRNKDFCALHYDRLKRGVDLNAPILPAPSPLKMIMKDED